MCFAIFVTIVGRRWLNYVRMHHGALLGSGQRSPYNRPSPVGSQDRPGYWQGGSSPRGHDYPAEPPPRYEPPQQNIGLRQVIPGLRGSEAQPQDRRPGQPGWDSPQAPRELV